MYISSVYFLLKTYVTCAEMLTLNGIAFPSIPINLAQYEILFQHEHNILTDWDLSVALSSVGWPVWESAPNVEYASAGVRVEVLMDSLLPAIRPTF